MGKFLLVIVAFGAVVYTLFWLAERRRRAKSPRRSPTRPVKPAPRALGPDDDEEFLRQLEQRRRRAAREREKPAKPANPAKQVDKKPTDDAADQRGESDRDKPAPKDPGQPA